MGPVEWNSYLGVTVALVLTREWRERETREEEREREREREREKSDGVQSTIVQHFPLFTSRP